MFMKNTPQILSKDINIKGDFEFSGELLLEGKITGQIKARDKSSLTVASGARVQTEILTISKLEVHGLVEADEVNVTELVLHKNGVVNGKINAKAVKIMPGATYQGYMNIAPANMIESNTRKPPVQTDPNKQTSAQVAKDRLQGLKNRQVIDGNNGGVNNE